MPRRHRLGFRAALSIAHQLNDIATAFDGVLAIDVVFDIKDSETDPVGHNVVATGAVDFRTEEHDLVTDLEAVGTGNPHLPVSEGSTDLFDSDEVAVFGSRQCVDDLKDSSGDDLALALLEHLLIAHDGMHDDVGSVGHVCQSGHEHHGGGGAAGTEGGESCDKDEQSWAHQASGEVRRLLRKRRRSLAGSSAGTEGHHDSRRVDDAPPQCPHAQQSSPSCSHFPPHFALVAKPTHIDTHIASGSEGIKIGLTDSSRSGGIALGWTIVQPAFSFETEAWLQQHVADPESPTPRCRPDQGPEHLQASGRLEGRAQRRQHILDALFAVMSSSKAGRASVSEIVEAAGISRGALHYYFQSKDEVVASLMRRLGASYLGRMTAFVDREAERPDTQPRNSVGALVRWHFSGDVDEAARLLGVWLDFWGQAPARKDIGDVVFEVQEADRWQCTRALLLQRPDLAGTSAEALRVHGAALLAIVEGGLLQWRIATSSPRPFDRPALGQALAHVASAFVSTLGISDHRDV